MAQGAADVGMVAEAIYQGELLQLQGKAMLYTGTGSSDGCLNHGVGVSWLEPSRER